MSAKRRAADNREAAASEEVAVPAPPPVPEPEPAIDERAEDADTARLVVQAQAGDRDSFATIYTRYFERIYGYMKAAIKDRHEAEDVAQQVFMEAMEALPRYKARPGKPFRAWLFTIARNQAVKCLRKQRREEPWETEALNRRRERPISAEAALRALEWIKDKELMLFVDRLPLSQRQVLMARFLFGMDTKEIAALLGRTPETVRVQQSRALIFLNERLTAVGRAPESVNLEPATIVLRQAKVVRIRRFSLKKGQGPTR